MKKILVALVLSLSLAGCSWRGQFSPDAYIPEATIVRIENIAVGLLDVDRPRPVKYGMSVDYQYDISDYIFALQRELETHFAQVSLIKKPEECPQCAIFAKPKILFQIIQRADLYRGVLRIDFFDKNERLLGTVSARTEGDASPDGATLTKTALNGAALGLLSASSIDDYGRLINAVAEQGVAELLSDAGAQIRSNPMLTRQALSATQDTSKNSPMPVNDKYAIFTKAVVEITTSDASLGSGFIINAEGDIITNAHVVGPWARVMIRYADESRALGEVVKVDRFRDLALVRTGKPFAAPLKLGSEKDARVGDRVIAVGSPEGLTQSVTDGIISQARTHNGVRQIQTDATVYHGSSGGPLIHAATGTVIGVTARGQADSLSNGTVAGLNFAISADEVAEFLQEQAH